MRRITVNSALILYAKKRIFSVFLALILVSGTLVAQDKLGISTVVIDAGHGGKDPGAIGVTKVYEKDVALSVALKLGDLIKRNYPKTKVVYTRSTDVFIGLAERAKKANSISADLFISIHANAAVNKKAAGAEVWVLGLHKSEAALEIAKKENSSILMEDDHGSKYQDFDPKDPDAYIGLAMRQNAYLDQSLNLANAVQRRFVNDANRTDRGVKQAGFMVLYRTTMPSILIELGFLSHASEEKYLSSSIGQTKLSESIFKGFSEYKNMIDGVNNSIKNTSPNEKIPESNKPSLEKPKTDSTVNQKDRVVFKVQISASSVSINTTPENFKGVKEVEQFEQKGIYKYTVGNFFTFEQAKTKQTSVRKLGFDSAFIIAFYNGQKIAVAEGVKLLKESLE
ncbi:MAG: N-acetylmuramoyl-L-alanine amidase [Flavobacteriales bacterium]|nr:N-acetylmuramoyl-L-alanine amidase [Flavobacteriales bacterium]